MSDVIVVRKATHRPVEGPQCPRIETLYRSYQLARMYVDLEAFYDWHSDVTPIEMQQLDVMFTHRTQEEHLENGPFQYRLDAETPRSRTHN